MKLLKFVTGAVAAGAAAEYAIASYFFNRTMIRSNAKRENTQKMAGTDWNKYIPKIRECKEKLKELPHEDMYIMSNDGLKLRRRRCRCW